MHARPRACDQSGLGTAVRVHCCEGQACFFQCGCSSIGQAAAVRARSVSRAGGGMLHVHRGASSPTLRLRSRAARAAAPRTRSASNPRSAALRPSHQACGAQHGAVALALLRLQWRGPSPVRARCAIARVPTVQRRPRVVAAPPAPCSHWPQRCCRFAPPLSGEGTPAAAAYVLRACLRAPRLASCSERRCAACARAALGPAATLSTWRARRRASKASALAAAPASSSRGQGEGSATAAPGPCARTAPPIAAGRSRDSVARAGPPAPHPSPGDRGL